MCQTTFGHPSSHLSTCSLAHSVPGSHSPTHPLTPHPLTQPLAQFTTQAHNLLSSPADASHPFRSCYPQEYVELCLKLVVAASYAACQPSYRGDTGALQTVLLGDAAHTMSPVLGQGLNSGVEDVAAFAQCLEQHQGNVDATLPAYNKLRLPDVQAILTINEVLAANDIGLASQVLASSACLSLRVLDQPNVCSACLPLSAGPFASACLSGRGGLSCLPLPPYLPILHAFQPSLSACPALVLDQHIHQDAASIEEYA